MTINPDKPYLEPYQQVIAASGPVFEALLWSNRATQSKRFAAIASLYDLTGRVIVDAGAGRGDLADWLTKAGIEYGAYIGMEAIEELREAAAALDLPESTFVNGDFVSDAQVFAKQKQDVDVTIFSGSLNTLDEDTARGVIERAWDSASEAVVFNFLSDRPTQRFQGKETGPAQRFNTVRMMDFALGLTPFVLFRQDYLEGNDATIALLKNGPTA